MKIFIVSYETPDSPCGGIAAVLKHLPLALHRCLGLEIIVISPFHHRLPTLAAQSLVSRRRFEIPWNGRPVSVDVLVKESGVVSWFLRPADARFFAGARHPYDLPAADLKRDALLFGAAVARAVVEAAPHEPAILLLQDWESAPAALALPPATRGVVRPFLTLHNSYDCPVTDADLAAVGIDPGVCPGATMLLRALPFVEPQVFTVSEQFARDFAEEPLIAGVMAPHLNGLLRPRLVGINNGPFITPNVDTEAMDAAHAGNLEPLRAWKGLRRAAFCRALDQLQPSGACPIWGDRKQFDRKAPTWFVMAGRDDPRQKGYEVAALAVDRFLAAGGRANFLFFPVPGDAGLHRLGFLEQLAAKFPAHALVFPFRFAEGYLAALQGANYGVMPSYYEPFGAAHEFALCGTVGIGRATGGITQQIVPLRSAACFSQAVREKASLWHSSSARPTGLLFRELPAVSTATHWDQLNAAAAGDQAPLTLPVIRAMADELRVAFVDGVRLHEEESSLYWRMVVAGVDHVQTGFSWHRAAQEYWRHIRPM
jgi:glycogen synthase